MGRAPLMLFVAIAWLAFSACGAPAPAPSPTVRPSPTPVPGLTQDATVILNLLARNIAFSVDTLDVRAGAPFTIRFTNADPPEVPHVVDLQRASGEPVLPEHETIQGGDTADYAFAALPPGDYVFTCRVHPIPSMTGVLHVR